MCLVKSAVKKFGDCSKCSATNTNVVKRGKELVCLNCKRGIDTKKQMQKEREKMVKTISAPEQETETIRTVEQERAATTEQKVAKF